MTLTVSTVITYNHFVTGGINNIADKIATLVSENKTDGVYMRKIDPTYFILVRHWVDSAAAQEWIDYINGTMTGENAPVSAVIVNSLVSGVVITDPATTQL